MNPRFTFRTMGLALAIVLAGVPAGAWGGKVKLERKYRPGESITYESRIHTQATVRSNPPGLKSFLPPLPTELSTRQRNTVTVRATHPEGTTDLETRFDDFEFQSNLFDQLPGDVRESAQRAQEGFSHRMVGQTLMAHYDREGRLLGFEGGEAVLDQLDLPVREAARYLLRLFLAQMGGGALYPAGRVKPGAEWKHALDSPPDDQFPFATQGETTLRYVGKTKYGRTKAAIVDFQFNNSLRPVLTNLRRAGPFAQLEDMGLNLNLGIEGQGQGRVLVALEDGRVLQQRSTTHQKLRARLNGGPTGSAASEPLTLEIEAETTLDVESPGGP